MVQNRKTKPGNRARNRAGLILQLYCCAKVEPKGEDIRARDRKQRCRKRAARQHVPCVCTLANALAVDRPWYECRTVEQALKTHCELMWLGTTPRQTCIECALAHLINADFQWSAYHLSEETCKKTCGDQHLWQVVALAGGTLSKLVLGAFAGGFATFATRLAPA